MKRAIGITACALVTLTLHLITPYWWWVIAVPLLFGVIRARSGWDGFMTGSVSAGIVWLSGCLAAYHLGGEIIAGRIAKLLMVGEPWILVAGTSILGMVAAGLACATGYHLKAVFPLRAPKTTHE